MATKKQNAKLGHEAQAPSSEAVGYKNPPKKHQFKKGQSGNPKGRPKKPKTLSEAIFDAVHKPKTVMSNGKPIKMAGVDVLASQMVKGAFDMKKSALTQVISSIEKTEMERAQAEARAVAAAEEAIKNPPFSWDEEREKLYAELKALEAERTRENDHDQE